MSTIIASNISDGTTSVASTYVVNGSAKAWVNFNGTSTVAIRDSLNVGSITDVGTGNYTLNFSNAFTAGTYAAGGMANDNGNITSLSYRSNGSFTASAFQVSTTADGANLADNANVLVAIHGDLA
jgi:hypothetical protein